MPDDCVGQCNSLSCNDTRFLKHFYSKDRLEYHMLYHHKDPNHSQKLSSSISLFFIYIFSSLNTPRKHFQIF